MTDQDLPTDDRSLTGRIVTALARQIIEGSLPPGERLRQDQIAAQFDTSHVPVREAFRRLEARGLVETLPRRGVSVAPLEAQHVREVVKMRAALESLALQEALPLIGKADLAVMTAALAEADTSTDIHIWEAANRRFHRAMMAPCGMPRLMRAIDDLHDQSSRYLFAAWRDMDWSSQSAEEHAALLEAIENADVEQAILVLRAHILQAGDALADRLAEKTSA